MDNSWDNHEPAPLEYFHGLMMDLFHEYRRAKVGQDNVVVEMTGIDLGNIIARAKMLTYQKYPKHITQDAIPKSEIHAPAVKGAVWVKASERLPEKNGLYCFRANGGYMGAYVDIDKSGRRYVHDSGGYTIRNWKEIEWLDETPTAAGDAGILERLEAIRITDMDAPVFTHSPQFRKHFEYIQGKFIEILRGASSQPNTDKSLANG